MCVFVVVVRFFCFESVISIPLHAARGAMAAAACRCPSQARNSSNFPSTGIPLSYPEPACAVMVGSHNISFSPCSARKHYLKQRKRVKQLHHPHKRKETEGKGKKTRLPTTPPQLRAPRLLSPPSRPPVRPPPRRLGPQHREPPSSFPFVVGVATSTPSMHAGQSSWPRRHQPLRHEDLHSLRTSP